MTNRKTTYVVQAFHQTLGWVNKCDELDRLEEATNFYEYQLTFGKDRYSKYRILLIETTTKTLTLTEGVKKEKN